MILTRYHRPLRLAYIENSREDAEAFLKSWQDYRPRLQNQIDLFSSADAYLQMQQVPFPLWHDVILVDLLLPGTSGQEFIQIAKAQPEMAGQSLIITTSSEAATAQQMQRLTGAEGWAEKPIRAAGILHELGKLDRYGLELLNLDAPVAPGREWGPEPA